MANDHGRLGWGGRGAIALAVYTVTIVALYASGIVPLRTLHSEYILLFPLGIAVAVIAMSTGISGSNFWVPINVIVLHVEPRTSFWLALFTMLFGFGSGVAKHLQQNTIRPSLVGRYLAWAIPGAIIGALIAPHLNTSSLLIAFGVFVGLYGARLLLVHRAFEGRNERITLSVVFVGGLLKGMIATGLGKLLLPRLLHRPGLSHPEAVGTVVCIVFLTNVTAVIATLCHKAFLVSLTDNWEQLFSIMVIVAPAVIVGGQIGPRIPVLISEESLVKYVGTLLVTVSVFMILRGIAVF